jgi:hypothetical protein
MPSDGACARKTQTQAPTPARRLRACLPPFRCNGESWILDRVDPIGQIGNNIAKPTLTNGRLSIADVLARPSWVLTMNGLARTEVIAIGST